MMTDRRRTAGAAATAVITTHWGISMETSASLFSDPEQVVPRTAAAPHPAPADNPFLAPPEAPDDEDAS
jgi:hypothetical protein